MIERIAKFHVQEALRDQAAVALIGPRQVGKTTLAHQIGETTNALYLDLEDRDDRAKLKDPALFLEAYEDRLVILDEIHRVPELFETLRGVIDRGRRKGLGRGRFLLLGSASLDLLKQSGETLAGRISFIPMGPIQPLELARACGEGSGGESPTIDELWLRGGFPDSLLALGDRQSLSWRQNFVRTYLERDVPLFAPRLPGQAMDRLWTMLAHRQGTMLNTADFARGLEVSAPAIGRYIDLLGDLLLVRLLLPYATNIGKRLVKSPKVFVRDSGLVHALLGISSHDALLGHPVVGTSWEGFVVEALISAMPWGTSPFFLRSAAGAEIDLLLEMPGGDLWAIDIKRSHSAKPERGFYIACADVQPRRAFALYSGEGRYPLSKEVEAIGLRELCELLNAYS